MSATPLPVTLQINLSPADFRHARLILPHQLKFWQSLVSEVLVVIDENRPKGRFSESWEEGQKEIWRLARSFPIRAIPVDYDAQAAQTVAKVFFGGRKVPAKDCRGGPYYSYFFGLYSASHDWILHCDADIFFGGDATHWLSEAIALYKKNADLLFTAPLPGPPALDGKLRQLHGIPQTVDGYSGFAFPEMSTRLFLVQRSRLIERLTPLKARPAHLRARLLASLDGNPPYDLPENTISRAMNARGLKRFDFAGSAAPGCWSLHPPYRCADFYEKLPELIRRIESGDLPKGQLGDHDINDSLVDWTEARVRLAHGRWWRRLSQRLGTSRS